MTALQEREIKNEMINCIERMDGRDIQILLNVAKRFISIDDLEDELEEAADLKAIEESEKEFAAGEALILEI
ncbi:MAG: hypothetical protein J6I62_10330 [Selenomonadaceae bacterium]|nr:hypothetical protein [Selenomonadaceae bacterium]